MEGVQEASTKNKINESVSFFSLFSEREAGKKMKVRVKLREIRNIQ